MDGNNTRIGIFGGTFNPPHIGHVAAARACVEQLQLRRLLMIPTNIPPHKVLPEGSASPKQRMEMVRLAASMVPMAEACDLELRRKGPSYTADTVVQLKVLYPDSTLWLVVGTDMLETFHRWYRPEQILSVCRLAAVARGREDREKIERQAEALRRTLGARVDIIEHRVVEGSSTQFRSGSRQLVPSEILRYIRSHRLYGMEA